MPHRKRQRYFQKYLLTAFRCFNRKIYAKLRRRMELYLLPVLENRHWSFPHKFFGCILPGPNFAPGEMAERSIAAVLKTVEVKASGGSNPSLSANQMNAPALPGHFCLKPPTPGSASTAERAQLIPLSAIQHKSIFFTCAAILKKHLSNSKSLLSASSGSHALVKEQ